MLNEKLRSYITKRLEGAAEYVTRNMPINASTDAIYEGIIGEPHVLEAFRNAVQYLPPAAFERRVNVVYKVHLLSLRLNLPPTDKYPVFLMPKHDLKINSESEFGRALALPLKVAVEWEMLKMVWDRLGKNIDNCYALAITFPWLSPLLTGFEIGHLDNVRMMSERDEIKRQVNAIHSGKVPSMMPGLTTWVNTVCKSGRELMSQFRMIEAAVRIDRNVTPRVQIVNMSALLPVRFPNELNEVVEEWCERQADARAAAMIIKRRGKR